MHDFFINNDVSATIRTEIFFRQFSATLITSHDKTPIDSVLLFLFLTLSDNINQ